VYALIKEVIIMKAILSLAKMDAILAIVLLDRSLAQRKRVHQILLLALMKETHIMKEIHSLAKMDVILAIVLLARSIVPLGHVVIR